MEIDGIPVFFVLHYSDMNTQNKKQFILWGAVLFAVVIGGGYYLYTKRSPQNNDQDFTVSQDQEGNTLTFNAPAPALDRFIINNKDLPPEARPILLKKLEDTSALLKKDTNNLELWVDLGIYRKTAGDYEGARDAWEYATVIRPEGSVAYSNLGDLYAFYLKDFVKAEKYFLQAIQNEPTGIYLYFKTAEFYRDVLKNIPKARAIVEQGISSNPSSTDLKSLLSSLK